MQMRQTLATMQLVGCASPQERDLAYDHFPEAQAELREVFEGLLYDAKTANVEGLRAGHLNSDKFTKFGGQMFERMNIDQCNETEAAFFASIQDPELDMKDLKIDVFGEVAILTFYGHISFKKDGEVMQSSSRHTVVFLKTVDGWKIIHEHRTPKAWYEAWSER